LDNGINAELAGDVFNPGVTKKAIMDSAAGANSRSNKTTEIRGNSLRS
jgi:hypothetical protein